jgi:hypothetical protein
MSQYNQELVNVLDFIMNRATSKEIEAVKMAMTKRAAGNPRSVDDLNFADMAKAVTSRFSDNYVADSDEIHNMTKRLVSGMIREKEPGISDRDLNSLLDQWVPGGPKQKEASRIGKESMLPPEAVFAMVDQFVRYSINKMPDKEIEELRGSMKEWHIEYWNIFSMETRVQIKELLEGRMDLDIFWTKMKTRLLGKGK